MSKSINQFLVFVTIPASHVQPCIAIEPIQIKVAKMDMLLTELYRLRETPLTESP